MPTVCLGHTSSAERGRGGEALNRRPCPTEDRGVPRASIVLFLRTLANDYQELLREDCTAAAARRGYDLTVLSAENDSDRQARQIRDCLAEKTGPRPTAMLVSPVR